MKVISELSFEQKRECQLSRPLEISFVNFSTVLQLDANNETMRHGSTHFRCLIYDMQLVSYKFVLTLSTCVMFGNIFCGKSKPFCICNTFKGKRIAQQFLDWAKQSLNQV